MQRVMQFDAESMPSLIKCRRLLRCVHLTLRFATLAAQPAYPSQLMLSATLTLLEFS